jgi:hypothetical protein
LIINFSKSKTLNVLVIYNLVHNFKTKTADIV